jgi:site-specific DNA-methyltransferase (adenine-specific)
VKPYYQDSYATIYHGDCREILPGLPKVDLVLTDPPFDEKTHAGARTGAADKLLVDFDSITSSELQGYFSLTRRVCDKWQVAFVDWRHVLPLEQAPRGDLELIRFGVWVKPNGMPQYSGDRPATGWEAIVFLHPHGKKKWNGGGRHSVFVHNFEQIDRFHPTQKPLHLLSDLVGLFSNMNDTVLDPFMGSGTTLRAAKDLQRKAIGIEIEERYCEIAAKRLAQEVLPLCA